MDLDRRNAPAKNWLALRRVPCDGFCPKSTICCKDTACRQLERLQRPGAYLQSGETTQNDESCPIGRGLCETSTSSSVHSRRRGGEKASRHFILRGTATPDSHARAEILACRLDSGPAFPGSRSCSGCGASSFCSQHAARIFPFSPRMYRKL